VNEGDVGESDLVRVVLGDANVLYPRVLRDYLLYAADQEVISIAWSGMILDEVTRHLVANVPGFTEESGKRLVSAMNAAFPFAEVEPSVEHYQRLRVSRFRTRRIATFWPLRSRQRRPCCARRIRRTSRSPSRRRSVSRR
jgi:hypothetical protein